MDLSELFDAISDCGDDELLDRVRAMVSQIPQNSLSRLSVLPSYISALQGILDPSEEKKVHREPTLDKLRNILQALRDSLKLNLVKARQDFEALQQVLVEKGKLEEAKDAEVAIERIAKMQESDRVVIKDLPDLDDLYSTLLSAVAFER